jgi:hypothetical protein
LESIRQLPQSQCAVGVADDGVLSFLRESAAASSQYGQESEFYRRTISESMQPTARARICTRGSIFIRALGAKTLERDHAESAPPRDKPAGGRS